MGAKSRPPVQFRADGTVRIPLTKGYWTTIDAADYPLVSGKPWHALVCAKGTIVYAERTPDGRRHELMHRTLLGLTSRSLHVDHRDGDGLNNIRANLRICDHHGNQQNARKRRDGSSKYKGVSWCEDRREWVSGIRVYGKRRHLGFFQSQRQAARVYDAAAALFFGKFARTNFLPS